MRTYDFVHLVLHAADGRIEGRTKLQKMVYFAGVITGNLENLGYEPHYYGPYSSKVAGAIDNLRALKFVDQSVAGGTSVDNRGFEVSRYDYVLTEDGKQIAEEKKSDCSSEWRGIQTAVNTLKKKPIDYMRLSIAAKTYFLTRKNPELLIGRDSSSLREMARQFGWDVEPSQIDEAIEWLRDVKLIDV